MKFIRVIDNRAVEIIPEENAELPGVPITARYTAAFIQELTSVEDDAAVQPGDIYDPCTGTFSAPPPLPEPTLAELAEQKATEAAAALAAATQAQAEADAAAAAALAAETEPTT